MGVGTGTRAGHARARPAGRGVRLAAAPPAAADQNLLPIVVRVLFRLQYQAKMRLAPHRSMSWNSREHAWRFSGEVATSVCSSGRRAGARVRAPTIVPLPPSSEQRRVLDSIAAGEPD